MITPVHDEKGVTIYCGDCVEVMRTMPDNSVDSIVTDPPYGIRFMGKGSTGKGAVRENFKFIGIDNDKENIPLAIARINAPAQVELI